jgi:SAM-dependent methyltransferase
MRRPAFIARQASRPHGLLGRLLLGVMARETARFNDEVLDLVAPGDGAHLLEIGFGHGRTLAAAAARASGIRLAGLDVAPTATSAAARRCRGLLAADHLDLRVGDASALPWADDTFDAAYAVHVLYFWPDPARALDELRRVLRPGGRLVLGYRERSADAVARFPAPTYRFHSSDDLVTMLIAAGFDDVAIRGAAAGHDLRIAVGVAGTGDRAAVASPPGDAAREGVTRG